ncbi:MAG: phage portal protein [Gammaproteobacteria bacterium]|nr:MAG: phage portal protein [Gammaproteobacteria bacterium]
MDKTELLERLTKAGVMSTSDAVRAYNKPVHRKSRAYTAAQITRLTDSWTVTPKPADVDIKAGLKILVARSREQAQNNDYVRRFLSLCKTNVVGQQGIVMRPRSKDSDGSLDKDANAAINKAFLRWGRYGSPEVTNTQSLKMIERQFISTVMQDGEVLMLRHFGWDGNDSKYAVQFLDAQAMPVDYDRKLNNGNVIKMGVEFNKWRKPVAYHLMTDNVSDHYLYQSNKYQRIPAEMIFHRFLPDFIWQSRGVPAITSAMMRMNMLNGYEEAELVAARVGSSKMGFFVDSPEGGQYTGDGEKDDEGNYITDADPGSFERLPNGVQFQSWDPSHPTQAYKDFVKTTLRGIASGLGVNYNSLSNDLEGVNYNSLRQGAIDERAIWMQLQDWMIESFMTPLYEDWLTSSLFAGSIKINDRATLSPERFDKYATIEWQPRRWEWVDPYKQAQADKDSINARVKSISSVIRENGRDPEGVWAELAEDMDKLNELGIPPVIDGQTLENITNEDINNAEED